MKSERPIACREALISIEAPERISPHRIPRYNHTAIILHWVVAVLIAVNIGVGLVGASTGDKIEARRLIDLHKSVGLTIFGLVILRLLWRLAHTPPELPAAYSKLERFGAQAAHALLYAVMLLLPLSGYIHDSAWKLAPLHPIVLYGLVEIPRIGFIQKLDFSSREQVHDIFGGAHVYIGYVLYGLLALHVLAVAKHHFVDREDELHRMWPISRKRSG